MKRITNKDVRAEITSIKEHWLHGYTYQVLIEVYDSVNDITTPRSVATNNLKDVDRLVRERLRDHVRWHNDEIEEAELRKNLIGREVRI